MTTLLVGSPGGPARAHRSPRHPLAVTVDSSVGIGTVVAALVALAVGTVLVIVVLFVAAASGTSGPIDGPVPVPSPQQSWQPQSS